MGNPNTPSHDPYEQEPVNPSSEPAAPASKPTSPEALPQQPSGIRIDTEPQVEAKETLTPAEKYEVSVFRGESARKLAQMSVARQLQNLPAEQLKTKIAEIIGPLPPAVQKYLKGQNFKHITTIKTRDYLVEVNMEKKPGQNAGLKIDCYDIKDFDADGRLPEGKNKSDVKSLEKWLAFKADAINVLSFVRNEQDLKKMTPLINDLIKKHDITKIYLDNNDVMYTGNTLMSLNLGNYALDLNVIIATDKDDKDENGQLRPLKIRRRIGVAKVYPIRVEKPAPENASKSA